MMLVPVDRPGDPRVADYVNVKEADLVRRRGIFLAEGVEVVRTLVLRSRLEARSLFVSDRRLDALSDVLAALPEQTPVYVADRAVMQKVVGFDIHRGCLAAGLRPPPPAPADLDRALEAGRFVVVLEGVANHDNVGGIFRNAACFGADMVLLDPTCADPLYRKAIRTSMGSTLRVPFVRAEAWPGALEVLRARGYRVWALTPDPAADPLEAGAPSGSGRHALLLGTEGAGLSRAALDAASGWLRIGMAPGVDSLNVATASGIAMWAMRAAGRRSVGRTT